MPLSSFPTAVLFALATAGTVLAWDGVDSSTGGSIEIGKGTLVRPGRTIEIYDYSGGGYRDVDVQSIRRYGNSVEVDVYDSDSGQTRTLDREAN
ncbi:DUF5334 family protein [Neorhizobium vignae]|uniref:DUF5334 family protein n=1 Tax=Neorhizobium vignae TaxID=690585 RepID=UPI000A4B5392|nr:DUF5334 family protein [Neorhizobium vignae]